MNSSCANVCGEREQIMYDQWVIRFVWKRSRHRSIMLYSIFRMIGQGQNDLGGISAEHNSRIGLGGGLIFILDLQCHDNYNKNPKKNYYSIATSAASEELFPFQPILFLIDKNVL